VELLEQFWHVGCFFWLQNNNSKTLKVFYVTWDNFWNIKNCWSAWKTVRKKTVRFGWSAKLYRPWRGSAERSRWLWPQHEGTVSLERWHWPLTLWPSRLRESSGHRERHARTDQRVESTDRHSSTKVRQRCSRCFRHWRHDRLDIDCQQERILMSLALTLCSAVKIQFSFFNHQRQYFVSISVMNTRLIVSHICSI